MNNVDRQVRLLENKIRDNSHVGHIIGCVMTAGLWFPFWMLACMIRQQQNTNIRRKIAKLLKEESL